MSQLETFVAPRPNFGLIRLMTAVNRVFMPVSYTHLTLPTNREV